MASVAKTRLIEQTVTVTTNGEPVSLGAFTDNFLAFVKVSNRTAGTYTAKIQHSPDRESWTDLITFSAINTNTFELLQVVEPTDFYKLAVAGFVRAVVTVAAGPGDATVIVDLIFDQTK